MSRIPTYFSYLLALVLVLPVTGLAQEPAASAETAVEAPQTVLVATTNLYNAKVVSQVDTAVEITFDLSNRVGAQAGVKYAVELHEEIEGKTIVRDVYVYDEVLSLNENETVPKSIVYSAPRYLTGEYSLWMTVKNESGLTLALGPVDGTVHLESLGGGYVEMSDCHVTVVGEDPAVEYALGQGVDMLPSESLQAVCEVQSTYSVDTTVYPQMAVYERSVFGKEIIAPQTLKEEAITLIAGETTTITMPLLVADTPQAYDTTVMLVDTEGNKVSDNVAFHYVVRGKSGTVQNAVLDKDYYATGDTAEVSLFMTMSADGFLGARHGDGTVVSVPTVRIAIASGDTLCATEMTVTLDNINTPTVQVPIERDCIDPTVTASLLDGDEVLDIRTMGVTSGEIPTLATEKTSNTTLIITIVVLILLIVMGVVVFKKQRTASVDYTNKDSDDDTEDKGPTNPPIATLLMLLLFGAALFVPGGEVRADTWSFGTAAGVPITTFTANLNSSEFYSNQNITVSGTGIVAACGNTHSIKLRAQYPSGAWQTLFDTTSSNNTVTGSVIFTSDAKYNDHYIQMDGADFNGCAMGTWGADSCSGVYSGEPKLPFKVKNTIPKAFIGIPNGEFPVITVGNSITLGPATGSSDPDGDIQEYQWTKDACAGDAGAIKLQYGTKSSYTTEVFDTADSGYTIYLRVRGTGVGDPESPTYDWSTERDASDGFRCDSRMPVVVAGLDAICGTADKTTISSPPTTDNELCQRGTQTAVTTNANTYTWDCGGMSGDDAPCSATRFIEGACGTADGGTYATAPSHSLCDPGAPSAVSTGANYTWTCTGLNDPDPANCTANIAVVAGNNLPNQPEIKESAINPHTHMVNERQYFSVKASDIDGDRVRYGISWVVDNVRDFWNPVAPDYVDSGTMRYMNHTWTTSGWKTLQAYTEDEPGLTSGWKEHGILICADTETWNNVTKTCDGAAVPSTNGVCAATHYNCTAGTSNPGAYADIASEYRWQCDGVGAGSSDSGMCTEGKMDPSLCGPEYETWVLDMPTLGGACSSGAQTNESENTYAYFWNCETATEVSYCYAKKPGVSTHIDAPDCVILSGQSTCDIDVDWVTTDMDDASGAVYREDPLAWIASLPPFPINGAGTYEHTYDSSKFFSLPENYLWRMDTSLGFAAPPYASDTSTVSCEAGSDWNGTICVAAPTCSGSPVLNASYYPGDNPPPVSAGNGTAHYSVVNNSNINDSSTYCEYVCNNTYSWNSFACVRCTDSIPTNATAWDNDGNLSAPPNGLSGIDWEYSRDGSSRKCEFYCDTDFVWNSNTLTCDTAPAGPQ